jgi:hypothetical protein
MMRRARGGAPGEGSRPPGTGEDRRGERLAALALLGFLLFDYPLLALFSHEGTLLGVPTLYAYLFTSWAALIALMALTVRRSP